MTIKRGCNFSKQIINSRSLLGGDVVVLTVFSGGHTVGPLEGILEIIAAVKAAGCCDGRDGVVGDHQHLSCLAHAHIVQVFLKGDAHFFLKLTGQIGGREIDGSSRTFQRDGKRKVPGDVLYC